MLRDEVEHLLDDEQASKVSSNTNDVRAIQIGGTVDPRRYIYLERDFDISIKQRLLDGGLIVIGGARQTGKSSLAVNTLLWGHSMKRLTIIVDLTAIGGDSFAEWVYYLFAALTRRSLVSKINTKFERPDFETFEKSPIDLIINFAQTLPEGTIVALDEIDSIYRLSYRDLIEELIFELLPRYSKNNHVTWLICGMTTGLQTSWFGHRGEDYKVNLSNFGKIETMLFLEKVGLSFSDHDRNKIYDFSGGQPFILAIIAKRLSDGEQLESIVNLVDKSDHKFIMHIESLTRLINQSPKLSNNLRSFVKGKNLSEIESLELLFLGILKKQQDRLIFSSQLYEHAFIKQYSNRKLSWFTRRKV